MTKQDIAEKFRENSGLPLKDCKLLVETVLEIMKETLETGEKVKISGFGVFEVKGKRERKGRNPQTGEDLILDPRKILRFKASEAMKKKIAAGAH